MGQKRRKKSKKAINIRTITTWVSVGVLFFLSGIITFTAWFMMSTLSYTSNPPVLAEVTEENNTESINVLLLREIEERFDEKISRPISDPVGQRNPFVMIRPEQPPSPEEAGEEAEEGPPADEPPATEEPPAGTE